MEQSDRNAENCRNPKANIEAKSSNKVKTVPPVRQTLTSYKRMLKANPLLKLQEAGVDVDQFLGFKSEKNSLKEATRLAIANSKISSTLEGKPVTDFKKPEVKPLRRTQSLKVPKSKPFNLCGGKPTIISGNLPLTNNHFKKPSLSASVSSNNNASAAKSKSENGSRTAWSGRQEFKKSVEPKTKPNSLPTHTVFPKCKMENDTKKAASRTGNTNEEPKPKSEIIPLRRSLSSDDLRNQRNDIITKSSIVPTQSSKYGDDNKHIFASTTFPPDISPITEADGDSKNFVFKSPSAYERRSVSSFTPHSVQKSSLFKASTPASIETQHLEERLLKWLKSRQKTMASFKHLRCFGNKDLVKKHSSFIEINEENKENINTNETSECNENLKIVTTPESSKVDLPSQNATLEEELPKVAKSAMVELQELVKEDYPRAQCLGWLELIREKYKEADEEPEYWECRAAIEQSAGNVGNAVEFYKTAIIQGAKVSSVDKSLDQLLEKFSLLNISPNKSKQKRVDGDKERILREARTVFKSTIIQCAVHERKLKK